MAGEIALIVGAGSGLSASLARLFAREGMKMALAARSIDKLAELCAQTGARAYPCDAADPAQVEKLFDSVARDPGEPTVVVYNASARVRGPIESLDPARVKEALAVSAFAGFLVGQQAARRMLPRGAGTILFTGATASVKGFPHSASFAMGKFALARPGAIHGQRAGAEGHPRGACGDRRRHRVELREDRGGARRRPLPRSRRHRPDVPASASAAPQRLDLGGRGAPLDRDLLSPGSCASPRQEPRYEPRRTRGTQAKSMCCPGRRALHLVEPDPTQARRFSSRPRVCAVNRSGSSSGGAGAAAQCRARLWPEPGRGQEAPGALQPARGQLVQFAPRSPRDQRSTACCAAPRGPRRVASRYPRCSTSRGGSAPCASWMPCSRSACSS